MKKTSIQLYFINNKIISLILLLTVSFKSVCQDPVQTYEPQIVPPSPTAYQLTTYGNIPVVNSSGTFSHTIPLYIIDYMDIKLPITLNYSSNGVKVDQLASIVGTDWNLNTGGVIARVINGRPDETSTGWYPDNLNLNDTNRKWDIINLSLGRNKTLDTEQDWFSFNANGITGSFYFDANDTIHVDCEEYVNVAYTDGIQTSTFTITDSKGYKYVFGGSLDYYEKTTTYDESPLVPDMTTGITAWFLKEIVSPANNKITFTYSGNNDLDYLLGVSISMSFAQKEDYLYRSEGTSIAAQRKLSYSKLLDKIVFGNGSINFNYNTNSDYEGGAYVKDLTIKNGNETLKKISLGYDMIQCVGNVTETALRNRLFLESLSFSGQDNSLAEKYTFEYHLLDEVPARLSYSKDLYGYPGYSNNSAFSKKVWDEAISNYTGLLHLSGLSSLFTANTEVDSSRVFAGMLKKIIYPTGGYTAISYEANSTQNLVKKKVEMPISVKYDASCNAQNGARLSTNTFVLGSDKKISYTLTAESTYSAGQSCPRGDEGEFTLEIRKLHSLDVMHSIDVTYAWWLTKNQTINGVLDLPCETGDEIQIKIIPRNPSVPGKATATIVYKKDTEEYEQIYGGGARIKEITDYSDEAGYNKRTFYYNQLDQYPSEKSSMTGLSTPPSNHYLAVTHYPLPIFIINHYIFVDRQRIHFNTSPNSYLFRNRGQSTNYRTITEILETNGVSNGVIERTFKNSEGQKANWLNGPAPLSPQPFSNVNENLRNKLESEKIYKKQANNYQLVNKKNYNYQLLNEFILNSYVFSCPDMNIYLHDDSADKLEYVTASQYKNYIQNYKLNQITDSLYESTGTIVNNTGYTYGAQPYYNLTNTQVSLSAADVLSITNQYAKDKNNTKLINAGMVGIPLVTEVKKGSNTISKTEIKYDGSHLNPTSILSYSPQNFATSTTEITYDQYDGKGNLQQYTLHGSGIGTPISIIWSYGGQYPIAKIENATQAHVDSVLSILGLTTSTLATSLSPDMTKINQLRTKLPNAMVTTYTYRPLVGIETIIDPRGVKITYHYDDFGRLQAIKDENNKVIENYDYHYKN